MKRKIVIVGAGPAGSSLAIRLAVEGFDVSLIEREKFPRQKLCGEFISPECLKHFAEIGVLDEINSAGGERVDETTFFSPRGSSVTVPSSVLGGDAVSLSRAAMDLRLIECARSAGVRVVENAYVSDLIFSGKTAAGIRFRSDDGKTHSVESDLLVDATGRTGVLSRLAAKKHITRAPTPSRKPSFVGFKTHLKNADLIPGRCEIYFFKDGYGGITRIEDGLSNLCFLVKADRVRKFKSDADEIFRKLVMSNERARQTLSLAVFEHEWLAVPLSGYGRKNLNPADGIFSVGDAAAFIDPFTGSGMLMALESSAILYDAIVAFPTSLASIATRYAAEHRSEFDSRLRTGAILRRAAFIPFLATAAIQVAGTSLKLTELLARLTRRRAASALSRR